MGPAGTSGVSLNQWWTDGRTLVSGSIEPLVVFTPLPPTTLTTAARNHLIVTAGGTTITIIITE